MPIIYTYIRIQFGLTRVHKLSDYSFQCRRLHHHTPVSRDLHRKRVCELSQTVNLFKLPCCLWTCNSVLSMHCHFSFISSYCPVMRPHYFSQLVAISMHLVLAIERFSLTRIYTQLYLQFSPTTFTAVFYLRLLLNFSPLSSQSFLNIFLFI